MLNPIKLRPIDNGLASGLNEAMGEVEKIHHCAVEFAFLMARLLLPLLLRQSVSILFATFPSIQGSTVIQILSTIDSLDPGFNIDSNIINNT